jgi:hypothetical protein
MCFHKEIIDVEVFFLGLGIYQRNVLDIIDDVLAWKPRALFVFTIQIEEASAPMPETTNVGYIELIVFYCSLKNEQSRLDDGLMENFDI